MDKVIVIGCSVPGYGVIRALAQKNIQIIALTYSRRDFAHFSKYVSEVMQTFPPEVNEEGFINVLIRNSNRWAGALILETSDSIAIAISKNREELTKYYKVVTPDWEILKIFVEKEKTYALAKECGVPHPLSRHLGSLADLSELGNIVFPCILKPVRSFEFQNIFKVKNFKVENEIELKEMFQLCLGSKQSVILQEVIPGSDENLFKLHGYLNSQGKMTGKFFYKKLRQSPPKFGVMRVGVSTENNIVIERLSSQLLNHVNYHGYFNTEFKMDSRDNTYKLIEVNCRMPRGIMLPTASGVNFPWLIYQDLVLDKQIDITKYTIGTHWIEIFADLSNTIRYHGVENIKLRDYLRPYFTRYKVFADLDFHDLKPFTALINLKLKNALKGVEKHRAKLQLDG